jgi:predicted Rossmann fold flavoprotein
LIWDAIIVGGGASGYFAAINIAEKNPSKKILILEKSGQVLGKVKVSGGGRCNVTNSCFIVNDLVKNYPRGEKELKGPFNKFMTGDMMAWLSERGVETNIEEDGRVFPSSNSSQTIIDLFVGLANQYSVKLNLNEGLTRLEKLDDSTWKVNTSKTSYQTKNILIATGSSKQIWQHLQSIGIEIAEQAPSLFTFNIKDKRIDGLQGISVPYAEVVVNNTSLKSFGPLLITHWGMSGPAVLKLSAWGALELAKLHYKFSISVNWISETAEHVDALFKENRNSLAKKQVLTSPQFNLPKRLWESFVLHAGLEKMNWADASKQALQNLRNELIVGKYLVDGKSTFKDEFVTCGGVDLKQIDFKTMQVKNHAGLYVIGEALNIDAITGGFNFQAAWTTAWLAAEDIAHQ